MHCIRIGALLVFDHASVLIQLKNVERVHACESLSVLAIGVGELGEAQIGEAAISR
jgi:hypothetical protein